MAGLKRRALQATSAPHTPATHPSHTPQPHTPATHPSYTRQLHLQLPITATPLSCNPLRPASVLHGHDTPSHPIVGDLRAQ